uniref:ARAD1C35772p n=1 Tax=Blastobotrys adeninivorans TaxID=409370 RepID=A0A060T3R3_BLAAD
MEETDALEGLTPPIDTKAARRNSEVDGIHVSLSPSHVSPAQLYSTESGRLFHAGKICIVLVGLPARGKTHHAVGLTRYLRWLGVKAHAFHLGDYRRKLSGPEFKVPDDYFMENASPETVEFRRRVIAECMSDVFKFLNDERGQVAIYDAVNHTAAIRRRIVKEFQEHNVQTLFVECLSTDENIVIRNIRDVKLSSPDYHDMSFEEAVKHYLRRIELRIPHYETINEPELSYVKLINVSERVIINNAQFGYLHNRIIFFLMNTRIKIGSIYFARAGQSDYPESDYKSDAPLSERGHSYAQKLKQVLYAHLEERRKKAVQLATSHSIDKSLLSRVKHRFESAHIKPSESISPPVDSGTSTPRSPADALAISTIRADTLNERGANELVVWSSTRQRTVETANYFAKEGIHSVQKVLLNQLNPGDAGGLSDAEIRTKYASEYDDHKKDPYHHRYPRAESYHDLAVRMEPLIMEMERTAGDILIIAHESVLRVLYGYLMACSVTEIPFLRFPRDEIVEIIPNAYVNQTNRIKIPGVDP